MLKMIFIGGSHPAVPCIESCLGRLEEKERWKKNSLVRMSGVNALKQLTLKLASVVRMWACITKSYMTGIRKNAFQRC